MCLLFRWFIVRRTVALSCREFSTSVLEGRTLQLFVCKHSHLAGGANLGIFRANRQVPSCVSKPFADSFRPCLKFGSCPLKSVVLVPKFACRQRFKLRV